MSHSVIIKEAVKKYGDFTAVDHISLEVKQGEFFTLLGPSGCGKTTLLRMIAGFNELDGGEIYFDSVCVNNKPAHKRDIGMVFQNYAIFPHLTVRENVAYGLKARKTPAAELRRRVDEAMKMVRIDELADRKPNELSGGQQQRVALARAFVIRPTVLLMDEPLSNLDAKLRVQMRSTIKKLQRELGITTIYVTHDQEEALAISDRIAVMKGGKVMQVGTPTEIYTYPAKAFVANFIGVSNFLDCMVTKQGDICTALINGISFDGFTLKKEYQGRALLSARPEQLFFADQGLSGRITLSTFLGDFIQYEIALDSGGTLILNEYTKDGSTMRQDGETVKVSFDTKIVNLYDRDREEVLT